MWSCRSDKILTCKCFLCLFPHTSNTTNSLTFKQAAPKDPESFHRLQQPQEKLPKPECVWRWRSEWEERWEMDLSGATDGLPFTCFELQQINFQTWPSLPFFPSAMLELSSPCLKQTNDSTLLLCNSQLQAEQTPSEGNSVVIEPSSIRLPLERFGVMLLRQHYSWMKHKTFFRAERFCRKRLM